jgi:hypothetical protein
VVIRRGGWAGGLTASHRKILASYEILDTTSDLESSYEHSHEPYGPIKGGVLWESMTDLSGLRVPSRDFNRVGLSHVFEVDALPLR